MGEKSGVLGWSQTVDSPVHHIKENWTLSYEMIKISSDYFKQQ